MRTLLNRRRVMGGGEPPNYLMTTATNPEVLAICYAQGWCASSKGMTYEEAAAVTSIGSAFNGKKTITHFEEFEYFGVTAMSDNEFFNTTNLKNITLARTLTTLGSQSFRGSGIETFIVPVGCSITNWGGGITFYSNNIKYFYSSSPSTSPVGGGLTKLLKVVLDENVRTVGTNAFRNAAVLNDVSIAEGVKTFGADAFSSCTSLESIVLPSTVTTLNGALFSGDTNLLSVTILAATPPTGCNSNTFNNCPNVTIYVPSGSVTAYQTASGWSSYANKIQAIST